MSHGSPAPATRAGSNSPEREELRSLPLSFDVGGARFNYRVAAVLIQDGHVLLHRAEGDDYWALPGGRGEILESSVTTLEREMEEELGVTIRVERLLWVVESFFTLGNRPFHEIGLYYKVSLNDDRLRDKRQEYHGTERGARLIFRWFPIEDLRSVRLYPAFLREGLQGLPATVCHVIVTE